MIPTPTIRVEREGALAIVNLAQPERGNPIDDAFTKDFRALALQLGNETGLRAVLMRADGANFSFGGDLKTFGPVVNELGPLVRQWTADLHMGLQRFWSLPVPVVCAVQGYAMGGGVGVLAGCDVVLAGQGAKFGAAFSQIGFSCDSGSSATLTARMGMARARRFILLSEVLSATDAHSAGLADQVVPDAELQDQAVALARRLAAGPTLAYGEIKRLFMRAGAVQMQAQLEDEALTLARVATSADAREGITAMLEKRKPVFQGR